MQDNLSLLKGLIKKAEALRAKSRFHESLEIYFKAKEAAAEGYDIEAMLEASIGAAHAARLTGDFAKSIALYEDALDFAEAEDKDITAADCMTGLSLSLKGLCRWDDALGYIKPAQAIYKKHKDSKGLAYALWAEGAIWRVAGDIGKSIASYKRAKKLFDDAGFHSGIAYCFCGLGGCTRIAGDAKKSLQHYTEANKLFRSLKDIFGKAYSHCGIGNAFRMLMQSKEAEDHFRRAAELYEGIGDIVSYSYTLWSMANLLKVVGQFDQARLLIARARSNFHRTGDLRGIVYCMMTEAEIKFFQGDRAEALIIIEKALDETKRLSLALENRHSALLYDLMTGSRVDRHKAMYKEIGVTLRHASLPLHMP